MLQKQLNIQNRITTKICSLLKEGDCNHTLESKFSHIWIFSWAEIGFAYFASSSIICLLHSECIPILSGYIIAALPYTIWSIWTQRVRTKQWCPLCLIVMSIFWILFFLFLYTNRLEISWHHTSEYIYIGLIYCCSILLINRSISFISNVSKNEEEIHQLRAIKYNGDIFNTLLNKSDWYDITLSTSCILFGKRNSKLLITILTNPYCEPCAEMHYRLKKIMQHDENRYCIQYIISNYNNPSSNSGKMLISAYLNRGEKYASLLFDNWFKYGKYHDEDFFKNENITIEDKANEEYSKHTNWIEQNNIMATPTLFINGYKLPNEYKIEDLNHILFNDDE